MAENGVSRRRVLVGAAWTAPVVLVATSAPAAATSVEGIVVIYNYDVADFTFGNVEANATFATQWASGFPPDLGDITFSFYVTVTNVDTSVVWTSNTFTVVVAPANPANAPTQEIELLVPAGTYTSDLFVWADADSPTQGHFHGSVVSRPSNPAQFTVAPA